MTGLFLGFTLLLASPPQVADFAFIAGHWKGELGKYRIEEVWTKPDGGAMMGMFRFIDGAMTPLTEFMSIEVLETGPVLHMRHFDPGFIGREARQAPLVWTLEKLEASRAVFYLAKEGSRLELARDGDTLVITLEKTKDGKATRTPFKYRLASPAP